MRRAGGSVDVILEGSSFTAETLSRAHYAPRDLLPALTEAEKDEAQRSGWTEEEYARSVYAQQLHEPEVLEIVDRLAHLLNGFLAAYLPDAVLARITVSVPRGLYRISVDYRDQVFHFSVRGSVVSDLFESGDEQALERLKRIVEMAVLPYVQKRQAS